MQNHPGTFRAFFATLAAAAFLALTLSSCAVTVALPGGGSTTTTPIPQPPNMGTGSGIGGGPSETTPSTGGGQGSGDTDDGGDLGPNSGPTEGSNDQDTTTPGGTDSDTGTDGGTTDSSAEDPKADDTVYPGKVPENYEVTWDSKSSPFVLTHYENCESESYELELPTGAPYKIGNSLFEGGGPFSRIVLPEDVVGIGKYAFQNAMIYNDDERMHELTIPQNVAVIGEYAFSNTYITKLTIEGTYLTGEIGEYAFANCLYLEDVIFKRSIKELPEGIFSGTGITDITLLDGLEKIGPKAFDNSALETIYIPKTVNSIDSSAFNYCNLETIRFGGSESAWAICSAGLLLDESVKVLYNQPDNQSAPIIDAPAVEFLEKLFSIFL